MLRIWRRREAERVRVARSERAAAVLRAGRARVLLLVKARALLRGRRRSEGLLRTVSML